MPDEARCGTSSYQAEISLDLRPRDVQPILCHRRVERRHVLGVLQRFHQLLVASRAEYDRDTLAAALK